MQRIYNHPIKFFTIAGIVIGCLSLISFGICGTIFNVWTATEINEGIICIVALAPALPALSFVNNLSPITNAWISYPVGIVLTIASYAVLGSIVGMLVSLVSKIFRK